MLIELKVYKYNKKIDKIELINGELVVLSKGIIAIFKKC